MKSDSRRTQETLQLTLDPITFKMLLRDLIFREAGKPYFKRLAIPRRWQWLGRWRRLSTYEAERQLLPVGGRGTDRLIQQFFTTYGHLQVAFQEGGMPITAVQVLHHHCPPLNTHLEQIQCLECCLDETGTYSVMLTGGPRIVSESTAC